MLQTWRKYLQTIIRHRTSLWSTERTLKTQHYKTIQLDNQQNTWTDVLPKRIYGLQIKAWKGGSASLAIRKMQIKTTMTGGPSKWQMSKMWRSTSSWQIDQKYFYKWNNSYTTSTERWQKTSDFPKGKKIPTYLAVWLTGSWCSGLVSGLSLWGGRAKFRTLDHQRPPGPT